MAPRLLVLAPVLLLAGLAACGESEEVAPSPSPGEMTATPAAASPTPVETATPLFDATPLPTPAADWATLADPVEARFSVRYPQDWFLDPYNMSAVYSSDPATFEGGPSLPPGVLKVEFGYYPDDGVSGCGQLQIDPETGMYVPSTEATKTTLGGAEAWQIVREKGAPAIEGTLTRIHGISAIHEGYCFNVAGYFTQAQPDISTFEKIVSSFEYGF